MNKYTFLLTIGLACSYAASYGQQNVGIGTTTPNPSAKLEIASSDQGLLMPTMNTAERDAIANPAAGLVIYNTSDSCFNYFTGSAWVKDCGRDLNADLQPGFAISGGGGGHDDGISIATDHEGNVYVTGFFRNTAAFGDTTFSSSGDGDYFIVKYNASGIVQWARSSGGVDHDSGSGIAIDASSNIYVTGYFEGTVAFGDTSLTSGGFRDVFLVKYDSAGNEIWARRGGGTGYDESYGIAMDSTGNVYVTGYIEGTASFGANSVTSAGAQDIFLVKYNSAGTPEWARRGGSSALDIGFAVAANDGVYITGTFQNTATFQDTSLTSMGSEDIFIVKYNSSGDLQWARDGGSGGDDRGLGIATNTSDQVYLTGYVQNDATFGSILLTVGPLSFDNVFLIKYDASGLPVWGWVGGASGMDIGNAVATDLAGNIYVTGSFANTVTLGDSTWTANGSNDVFVLKFHPEDSLIWARRGGSSYTDYPSHIATDVMGNAYVLGNYTTTTIFGTVSLTSTGGTDYYVVKYNAQGSEEEAANHLTASQDRDSDPTNELQSWGTLPGIPAGFADGTDHVDDADNSPTNELQSWSNLPGIPAGFADGTDHVNDADNSPTNELQSWSNLPGIPAGFADGVDNVVDNLGNHTATTHLTMNNLNINSVGNLQIADPGVDEGLSWAGSQAKIFVSPLNGGNSDGLLRLINDGGISFEPGSQNTEALILSNNGNAYFYESVNIRGDLGLSYSGAGTSMYMQLQISHPSNPSYRWSIGHQAAAPSTTDDDLYFYIERGNNVANMNVAGYVQDSGNGTQMNFTGQHRSLVLDIDYNDLSIDSKSMEGMIVVSDQNAYLSMSGGLQSGQEAIMIDEALPIVSLCKKAKDKRVFGVISSIEPEDRHDEAGAFATPYFKEEGDERVYINSVGEGGIWIVDQGGSLEAGDYIQSSGVPGYGMMQKDDLLHNYTVAKITMDCNFEPNQIPKREIKKVASLDNADAQTMNALDDHGRIIWETLYDDAGSPVMENAYKVRYLKADGTQIDQAEYELLKAQNAEVYRAAFVGCTYHCG